MQQRILLLDTPSGELRALVATFREAAGESGEVVVVTNSRDLREKLREAPGYDLVVIDWFVGDGKRTGAKVLEDIRVIDPDLPVVAVAERGDVDSAADAVNAGATDFLVRGPRLSERVTTLLGKVRKLFILLEKNRLLDARVAGIREADRRRYRMVGASPQFRELLERIRRVAAIPRPVLITGERGTGKELVARAIHETAGPPDRPIVAVNCAAFPEPLLENELFGHEPGAYTGAEKVAPGKFEQASAGTLFLDEIGHMAISFQQKILRVVEYGLFTRVGGSREIRTGARILAATNADLPGLIQKGEFLPDLYDRLSFEVMHVPPLRERPEDIEVLAEHFLTGFADEIPAFRGKRLSAGALAALKRYEFPGNARELKNIIERAAYRDTTNEITPEDIGLLKNGREGPLEGGFAERVDAYKSRLILDAIEEAGGNQARAARSIGLSYHQFRYYFRKYAPPRP